MITDKIIHKGISIIGFPFTIINHFINKKNYINPLGEILSIYNREIHTIISGTKNHDATVVLDAGMGSHSLDYYLIQKEISKFARVVSFDRAGFGWSSPSEEYYTSEHVIDDLQEIFKQKEIKPPYILVGHSFGALNMRLFASKFSEQVAALIFIDGVHENRYLPEDWDELRKKSFQKSKRIYQLGYWISNLGITRLIKQPVGRKYLSNIEQKYINYTGYHPKAYEAIYKELLSSKISASQVKNAQPLPENLRVIVLSSNNQDPVWVKHQDLLCELTKNSRQIKTEHGHSIHLENPQLVIDVIKKVVLNIKKENKR